MSAGIDPENNWGISNNLKKKPNNFFHMLTTCKSLLLLKENISFFE